MPATTWPFWRKPTARSVAKVNAWFDQTMDRVSDRFTFTTRGVTFVMAVAVAFVIQLDTPLLVNRLATDPQLRASVIQQAIQIDERQHAWDGMSKEERSAQLQKLAGADLVAVPEDKRLGNELGRHGRAPTVMGVILSAILLSFGAPFWYNALKNLLRLRSLLAQKDDDQRTERQTPRHPAPRPNPPQRRWRSASAATGGAGVTLCSNSGWDRTRLTSGKAAPRISGRKLSSCTSPAAPWRKPPPGLTTPPPGCRS